MSVRHPLLFLAPILLLAMVAPVPTAAAVGAVELTGTLELVHGEDFDSGAAIYDYHLETKGGSVAVRFPGGTAPDGFVNGATVRVRGHRQGSALVALTGTTSNTQVLTSAPGWSGQRRLAVVLINFTNNATKPFSRSFANGVIFTNANSVRAYFAEESHNAVVLSGTTFDWIRIPKSNATCTFGAWELAAKAILAARGVDLNSYTNFMFMFPQTDACHWRGLAYVPGASTWINGRPTLRTSAHELAHNFGVHHASTLRCTKDGIRVALSSHCTVDEYGDPFTTMGAAQTRHDHNFALVQMGYLGADATKTITASGTYTLTAAAASSGVRILGIPRGNGTWFYLEYRRPYGAYFDNFSSTNPVVKGVTIRIASGWSTITQTKLIDTMPSTTTFNDAPLRLGRSFTDYYSGTSISVTALGSSTATVYVRLAADKIAPTAPGAFTATATSSDSVALAWTAGTDNRSLSGYRVWRGTTQIATLPASTLAMSDTGLASATTYTYTVRAVDGAGNLSPAMTASATTRASDTAPSAPGRLAAVARATWVQLSWTAATDNLGVTGYRIWLDGTLVASVSGLSFTLRGLIPDTTYAVTVRAIDTAGQVGAAATISFVTPLSDTIAPSSPVATIVALNHQWAELSWSPATDNVAVTGYVVRRNGGLYAVVAGNVFELRVPRDGSYTVAAIDAEGNESLESSPVGA